MNAYWDTKTLIFYFIMGMVSMFALQSVKKKEVISGQQQKMLNKAYIAWFAIWVIVAVFRKVSIGIGESDAIAYKEFFEYCLHPKAGTVRAIAYANHLDIGYQILCKIIRRFTEDYHVLFFIIYGILAFAYIWFFNELSMKSISYGPMMISFYLMLRGFSSIRTNLSAALLLISCVFMYKDKKFWTILFAVLSLFIHKATIFYFAFIIFYYIFRNRKISVIKIIGLVVIASLLAKGAQSYIINVIGTEGLDSSYVNYASNSLSGGGFFKNYWKMVVDQLALIVACGFLYKYIIYDVNHNMDEHDKKRFRFVWLMCIFDFALVPVCYILHIWRGYEYFFYARLILWGEIIAVFSKSLNVKEKRVASILFTLGLMVWMGIRVYSNWQLSSLSPYIFEPLKNLLS